MTETSPLFDFFDDEPIITPEAMHGGHRICLALTIKTAICTFLCEHIDQIALAPILAESKLLFYVYGRSGKVPVYQYRNECLIVFMTVGSPVAVAVVEELKSLGIQNIIAYGTAGLLDENISQDVFVLIEQAIRDEGASHHYLPASVYVKTDEKLTDWLEEFLQSGEIDIVRGITWTTDAMFRETSARCKKRKEQGAVVVEMECAGFAAACKRFQMRFAQFVFFSDTLSNPKHWHMIGTQPQFDARRSLKVTLLEALLVALRKIKLPN